MAISKSEILKALGNNPALDLYYVKGHAYWVFTYDTTSNGGIYETESVYVPRLNVASVEWWVSEGNNFLNNSLDKEMQKRYL